MQLLTGYLVIWSLVASPGDGMPAAPAASHFYWSHTVCEAAKGRMDSAIREAGGPAPSVVCTPYLKENPTPQWVTANVIGPCEPYYDDCGDVTRAVANRGIEYSQGWFNLARKAQQQPGAGPMGPRPFLPDGQHHWPPSPAMTKGR